MFSIEIFSQFFYNNFYDNIKITASKYILLNLYKTKPDNQNKYFSLELGCHFKKFAHYI